MNFIKSIVTIALVGLVISIDAGSSFYGKVDFYGHPLPISYDQRLNSIRFYEMTQREITGKLRVLRNIQLTTSSKNLAKQALAYGLDGTGTSLLIHKYAQVVTKSKSGNNQTFVKYLVLKELGYDVLLTKTGKRLNCLGRLDYLPGRYIFIQYNNKKYVDLDFKNRKNFGRHTIYQDSKITKIVLNRDIKSVPKINAKKRSKNIEFTFGTEKHSILANSNESITDFLGDLPLFEVGKDFTTLQVSKDLDMSVMNYLKTQMTDRKTIDQVRFLLAFVQQVVPYGSDYDKYGEERFYYPEETVMASTADCEDKTMLLAYLCRQILNIETVGLYFKSDEHISLGIHIPDYNPTGSFGYHGKRYVSCEPTAQYPRLTQSQFSLERVDEVVEF